MEVSIKTAAVGLLILRLISAVCLSWVMYKQLSLIRRNTPPEEQRVRKSLFTIVLALFLANIIPVILDAAALFANLRRGSNQLNAAGVLYTYSNAAFAAIVGVGWAILYVIAEKERVHLKHENDKLHHEVDDLQFQSDHSDR